MVIIAIDFITKHKGQTHTQWLYNITTKYMRGSGSVSSNTHAQHKLEHKHPNSIAALVQLIAEHIPDSDNVADSP